MAMSIAFRKSVWKEVGGYPDFSVGEDTNFVLKLSERRTKFAFAKDAIVYWRMRKNWREFFTQFYRYGKGDRITGNIWKMKGNLVYVIGFWTCILLLGTSLFFATPIFWTLMIIIFAYFLIGGMKIMLRSRRFKGFFYGMAFLFIKRIAYVLGVSFGK